MKFQHQTLRLLQFKINLFSFMCVLFYSSFVCISAYANVYFKTTIIKQNIKIILLQNNIHVPDVLYGSAIRFGQALPGYLITTHLLCACLIYLIRYLCGSMTNPLDTHYQFSIKTLLSNQEPKTKNHSHSLKSSGNGNRGMAHFLF